jgi:penicillin-binding protein 1A
LGAAFFLINHQWVDFSLLDSDNTSKPSLVLDNQGNEWARFQLDKREPVRYNILPQHLIQAFLAAEDRNFFKHTGISCKGIIRSILVNMYHWKKAQGASTITQQLVKLLFFDSKKTFSRKLKEQALALIIERQYSKEQILETYLNNVYFGNGMYGIQAAAQRFWNKNVQELDIQESALLAAIVKSPQRYCPIFNPDNALLRRNIVLEVMYACKYISQQEVISLKKIPLSIAQAESSFALYARENIRLFMEELVGKKALYTEGFVIQTTLNISHQETAEKIFQQSIEKIRSTLKIPLEGGMISIAAKTGAIQAYIGGYNFNASQFNRVHAVRQVGSTIKPLLYAIALQNGASLTDVEYDEPLSIADNNRTWNPRNVNKKYSGPMTLAHALALSNNIIAIKTIIKYGAHNLANLVRATHLATDVHHYPSLALGCVESSLFNVVGMFNIFNNNGYYQKPYLIEWIKDEWGTKIWKHIPAPEQVLPWNIISQINQVLINACQRIQHRLKLADVDYELLGKTGTTNDARTVWFAGCTPNYTTVFYFGRDDNKAMQESIFATTTAFPAWYTYNSLIQQPIKQFSHSPEVTEIYINKITGQHMSPHDHNAIKLLITS